MSKYPTEKTVFAHHNAATFSTTVLPTRLETGFFKGVALGELIDENRTFCEGSKREMAENLTRPMSRGF